MRVDLIGLLAAIFVWPLAVMAGAVEVERGVWQRAPEDLMWSVSTLLGAMLGLALHVSFSWGEWRKLVNAKMSLFQYIFDDAPGFMVAVILSIIAYFGMPVIGSIPAVQGFLGFAPGMNFLSSAAVSYIASSLGYKLRAFFRKKAEP